MSVEALLELYNQIRPTLELHLSRQLLAYRREKIEKATEERIKHALKWLQAFNDVRVQRVLEVERLVPKKMWDSYRHMGIISDAIRNGGGPWEVEQLCEAVRNLREDWKNRPTLLRKAGPLFEKGQVGKTKSKKAK